MFHGVPPVMSEHLTAERSARNSDVDTVAIRWNFGRTARSDGRPCPWATEQRAPERRGLGRLRRCFRRRRSCKSSTVGRRVITEDALDDVFFLKRFGATTRKHIGVCKVTFLV